MNSAIPLKTLLTFILIINAKVAKDQLGKAKLSRQLKMEYLKAKAIEQMAIVKYVINKYCNKKAKEKQQIFTKENFMDRRLSEEVSDQRVTVSSIYEKECSRKMLSSFDLNRCLSTGLSYIKLSHDSKSNIDYWGCKDCEKKKEKEAGNTTCYNEQPILCHFRGGYNRAAYEVKNPNYRYGWSEGMVKKGPSLMGCVITSNAVGDLICQENFGPGWKMATSRQGMIIEGMMGYDYVGTNWKANGPKKEVPYMFWAHGNVDDERKTFWVFNQNGNNCFENTISHEYWK